MEGKARSTRRHDWWVVGASDELCDCEPGTAGAGLAAAGDEAVRDEAVVVFVVIVVIVVGRVLAADGRRGLLRRLLLLGGGGAAAEGRIAARLHLTGEEREDHEEEGGDGCEQGSP